MKSSKLILGLCAALVAASAFAQATVIVYSQNPAPGDLFQNTQSGLTGASFGHPNWVYNNVRGNDFSGTLGSVGIRNDYPRSSNGSVYFKTSSAWGKADIEYFANPVELGGNYVPNPYDPSSILGPLADLTHLSYEWYRDSSSTAPDHLHPVLRLGILRVNQDNTFALGYLVFERIYNGFGAAPTNQWVYDDVINSKFWATSSLDPNFPQYDKTLADWVNEAANANATLYVISVNAGIGSGWNGTFTGAVDNITFGFNGNSTTYNFEVVPEPASMVALGSGLIGLLGLRRRKR